MGIKIKRAYEKPEKGDGTRILIDRLWPRGMSKAKIKVKEWMKGVSPTPELIKWFGHKPERWPKFKKKYKEQLKSKGVFIDKLKEISRKNSLTLVYSAKDKEHNNAVVLRGVLEKKK